MSNIVLEIEKRDETKNPRQIRAEGNLPATIYGKDKASVSVQLNKRDFVNTYKNNKDATFELVMGKEKFNAIVQYFQVEAGSQKEMHVEFKLV
ncbi:MAG: hypothetical protein PHX18_00455 [Candidatus Gastranaerophilales bacterium]|nr:hypothetical protein [Candidatus Gastranaerophilales bacterium]